MGQIPHGSPVFFGNQQLHVIFRISSKLSFSAFFNIFSFEIPNNGKDDDGNGYIDDVHGWDFANNDNNPHDDHSHGTHCAGTIGALGNNGKGVVGVCWDVSMVGIKFLTDFIALVFACFKFKNFSLLKYSLFTFLLYPLIMKVIIFLSLIKYRFKWKDRVVIKS